MNHIKDIIQTTCKIWGTALSLRLLHACWTPEGISQEKYNQAIKQRDSAIHVADSLTRLMSPRNTDYIQSHDGIDR